MFGDDPDGTCDPVDDDGVDLILLPPPLPGGGCRSTPVVGPARTTDRRRGMTLRQRKVALVTPTPTSPPTWCASTGWSHPQVNAELNRLSGVRKISEATLDQLEARLAQGNRWLRGFR